MQRITGWRMKLFLNLVRIYERKGWGTGVGNAVVRYRERYPTHFAARHEWGTGHNFVSKTAQLFEPVSDSSGMNAQVKKSAFSRTGMLQGDVLTAQ